MKRVLYLSVGMCWISVAVADQPEPSKVDKTDGKVILKEAAAAIKKIKLNNKNVNPKIDKKKIKDVKKT